MRVKVKSFILILFKGVMWWGVRFWVIFISVIFKVESTDFYIAVAFKYQNWFFKYQGSLLRSRLLFDRTFYFFGAPSFSPRAFLIFKNQDKDKDKDKDFSPRPLFIFKILVALFTIRANFYLKIKALTFTKITQTLIFNQHTIKTKIMIKISVFALSKPPHPFLTTTKTPF